MSIKTEALWEILVPASNHRTRVAFSYDHHRAWDKFVVERTGGLTVLRPTKGTWVSPSEKVHEDRMIPCRIVATSQQMVEIARFTADHYKQEAVMYYCISREVHFYHRPTEVSAAP